MNPTFLNIILTIIIAFIIGFAIFYIVKSFKSGKKCIGCPEGCSCVNKKKQIENNDWNSCNFEPVNTYINVQSSQEYNCNYCNSCKNHK